MLRIVIVNPSISHHAGDSSVLPTLWRNSLSIYLSETQAVFLQWDGVFMDQRFHHCFIFRWNGGSRWIWAFFTRHNKQWSGGFESTRFAAQALLPLIMLVSVQYSVALHGYYLVLPVHLVRLLEDNSPDQTCSNIKLRSVPNFLFTGYRMGRSRRIKPYTHKRLTTNGDINYFAT